MTSLVLLIGWLLVSPQCECAEWHCPKEGEGACACIKVKSCQVPKKAPKEDTDVRLPDEESTP